MGKIRNLLEGLTIRERTLDKKISELEEEVEKPPKTTDEGEKSLKINEQMPKSTLRLIQNKNVRIVGVSDNQKENLYEEVTVQDTNAEKFPGLENASIHILDA